MHQTCLAHETQCPGSEEAKCTCRCCHRIFNTVSSRGGHEKRRRKAGLLYKCPHLNTISVCYYQKVNRVKEKRSCPLAIQRRSSAPQVLSLGYPVTPYHILVFYSSSRDFVKKTTPQHSLINLVLGLTPSLQQKIRPL